MRRRTLLVLVVALAPGLLAWVGSAVARAQGETVLVTTVRGAITPIVADHLSETVRTADREGHEALLVELDTPGGLDTSMREIVQTFLGSDVPVVVYVAPDGARAASAGAFVTMSAHVAAMAPATSIGSSTPVDLEGGGDVERKVVEDAAAYAEALADAHGRNAEFAVDMVREGRSVPARTAERIGAIDLLASDRAELLERIDGTRVRLDSGRSVRLSTAGATVVEREMGAFRQLLQWLADPNVAFLLLSIGTLAIVYEIAGSGFGFGGILGVILVILALFGLSVLPVNLAGILLLLLAAGLFVAEVFAPGIGVFAAGGGVALALAGLVLFRGPMAVDPVVLLPTGVVVAAATVLAGRLVWRARRRRSVSGGEAMVGRRAVVHAAEGSVAQVFVDGAWWTARSADGVLRDGQEVGVRGIDGLDLIVVPEGRLEGLPEGPKEEE
jgi:membrane-bound serine protease (ClpP class)